MASLREESDSEESSYSLSDNENLAPQKKKRRGRKAQWQDRHVADMVDVIFSNDNFPRKLIFTMATASVKTGTQLRSSPPFNNFLKNKIKSLRWVSWSALLIGSYVTFVTFFRWPTYMAVSIRQKFDVWISCRISAALRHGRSATYKPGLRKSQVQS